MESLQRKYYRISVFLSNTDIVNGILLVFPPRADVQLALPFNAVLLSFRSENKRHVNFSALLDVYFVVKSDKFVPLHLME